IDDNYFELGGDSILSIQIVARARQAGISLDLKQIFVAQTIAVLAQSASAAEQFTAEQGLVTGRVPCTPIQHDFFSAVQQDAQHFNQSVLLEVSPDMDAAALQQALACLVEHHDALRMQVKQLQPAELFIPADCDLGSVFRVETFTQANDLSEQAQAVQASLQLIGSPLLRVVLFRPTDKNSPGRLLLVLHHLLVDGVSWRILLEDLHQAYQMTVKQQPLRLPRKTSAFIDWAKRLKQWAQTDALQSDQVYWQRYCQHEFAQLPLDHAVEQTITRADTTTSQLDLDSRITQALMQAPRILQASAEEVLLAALLETLWQWLGKKTLSIELEGHGRENVFADLDVSRTVGWFTSLFPLAVDAQHDTALSAIKTALRNLPNRGLSYGVLRYLSDQAGLQQQLQATEQRSSGIRFNYLGRFENAEQDSVFIGQAHEQRGEEHSGKQVFALLMDFNGAVHQDCLQLEVRYSPLQFDSDTIEQLLAGFEQQLAELLQPVIAMDDLYAESLPADGASHFALVELSEQRLKNIVERGSVQDIYPLSPLQHGLLFHSVYARQSSSYLQQVSWHFNGQLEVGLWRESWQQLIQLHPVLRTGFDWLGAEQPVQVVFEQLPFDWRDMDFSAEDDARQQQLVDGFLRRDRLLPFDIKATPLLRFALLRLSATQTVFVWSYHHILLDGWSLPKLIEDVFGLYAAKVTGQARPLLKRRPFHDYIAWLQDQDSKAMEAYWSGRLSGFNAVNKLAIDQGGDSHMQQAEFHQLAELLDQDLSSAMTGFAQQQRVTVNIVLQAAWTVLLSRYCNSRDILFGLTVSGRPAGLDQVGDMVGLFINTVPVRAQLSADQTVEQLLQQLFSDSLEREAYTYVQLAELQNFSQVQAGQGLFDSLFIFENYPMDETLDKQSSTLQLNDFQVYEQTDLPLTLLITPGRQLALKISYQQHRFEADAVQELLGRLQFVIRQMLSAPKGLLTDIGLIRPIEQKQLLLANERAIDKQCLPELCLHQLIARQAQQSADKAAVQFADQQLTYAQLEQQAELLAQHLLSLGITTESIVAICLPRSTEMPIALLAVLKTGAAYLPLDLNLPAKRLHYMVEDSGAELVLVKGRTDLEFTVQTQDVSRLLANARVEKHRPPVNVHPDNLAYVIYTSGSTGKPKAVQVSHKNIVNFMLTMANSPGINADDRLLAVTTLAFDIAALELYLPLTVGATVVLADSLQSADGHTLKGLLQQQDITVMQATPASWRLLLASGWQGHSRFKVLCGGEALPVNLAEQLQHCAGQVWNVYGPTETTVWSSRCLLSFADKVKLGEPLANTRLYVVDENLSLLPAGFPGELMIAGAGVARGYKNRADLTAERFIPDPFSGSGERMYRTGDQVVRHQDGSIEYLGRLDFQAKIRGYRIELGEIEARLEDRPDIQQAVAVVDQSREDNQQLLAYYRGEPLTSAQLRDYLAEYLPAYMLPTEFIHVQTFALTHSGKVDRKALPKPQRMNTQKSSANQPQTQTQKKLLEIWRQVLQREDFGTEDNFFDLGGHSLLLMQVWNLLQQQNTLVQTVDLFRYPSIAKLAAYLDGMGQDKPEDSVARAEQKAQRQKTGRHKRIKNKS
ncbi:MAG: amino acid adenylation domain-containing protein, partial [Gammaproteobacteria bacterium]